MGRRTANFMEKLLTWVRETSRKVVEAVYPTFKFSSPILKRLEEKREYYKERSNVALYTYLLKLGQNKRSIFGKNIRNFIESTLKSDENDSIVLMTNIRDFMNEMKNFLIANGGVKFDKEVAKAKVNGAKLFNLDDILENVVCELILMPLKNHLDDVIFKEYGNSVTTTMENMYQIKELQLNQVGVRSQIRPFTEEELSIISNDFYKMQLCELPSEKAKHFLSAVTNIYKFSKSFITGKKVDICADDFIPLLVWVLSNCRTFTVEPEGLYMWYLMNPSLRDGEYGYYITSLLCAGALLNKPEKILNGYEEDEPCPCHIYREEFSKEIKVVVIDQFTGLPLGTKIIPSKTNTRVKEICSTMAEKLRIRHPEFFGLFALLDGKAKLLLENDTPVTIQDSIRRYGRRKYCLFMYKEINRKIAWPFTSTSA